MTPLEELQEIQTKGAKYKRVGICGNLSTEVLHTNRETLFSLFRTWPKFSGEKDYPVPATGPCTAKEQYIARESMWEGPYGDLRKELLTHCIKELQKC